MEALCKVFHRLLLLHSMRPVDKYKSRGSKMAKCGVLPCITHIQLGKHKILIYVNFLQDVSQAHPHFNETCG